MEWISVKDRLPDLDAEVLVYVNGNSFNNGPYSDIGISYLTKYYGDRYEGWDWSCTMSNQEVVTHWMLLPEPPKGE